MIRETYNTETGNSNTDEMTKTKEGDGCPIALKGLVLAEKYIEDMKKSVKNHFEAFEIEGIERGIEEFKKLAMENVENSKKELELLKKENAQLKEKAASLPKQSNEESYFDC